MSQKVLQKYHAGFRIETYFMRHYDWRKMSEEQYNEILYLATLLQRVARTDCGSFVQELVDDLRYKIYLANPFKDQDDTE